VNRLERTNAVNYLELTMVDSATENCSKCGKQISVKNVASYKVLANFRVICVDCAIAEGVIAPPQTAKAPSGPSKKQPRRQ
jgi:hypothetical protein